MIGRERGNLSGGPVHSDSRVHVEAVAFDSRLKLLIAIVGEPDRAAGKKHRGQCHVERKRCVVAPAEGAAHIGKLCVDARRLEGRLGFAQEERDRLGSLVG